MTRCGICISAAVLLVFSATCHAQDQGKCADCSALTVGTTYTAEVWRNTLGGQQAGTAFLEKLDVAVGLDAARLFGNWAPQVFMRGFYANGDAVSGTLVGDAQGVSNIETVPDTRLFEFWTEWRVSTGTTARIGLYDLNSEFDSIAPAQFFINASQGIGKDVSQSGLMGPSIYPVTSFGTRLRWASPSGWATQIAVLDGVPGDPDDPTQTAVHLSRADGALLAAEVNRSEGQTNKFGVGGWWYTGSFDRLDTGSFTNNVRPAQRGSSGLYGLLSREFPSPQLLPEGGSLAAFARLGAADPNVNRFDTFVGAGIVYVPGHDGEQLGIGITSVHNGRPFVDSQRRTGTPADPAETTLELSWLIPLTGWLSLQPDVQYVMNPNTDSTLKDDLLVGIRFQVGWSSSH